MPTLHSFANRHRGERCWIMGNGPSLNRMDLSLLQKETVFASNAVYLLFDQICWRPRYYSCVDSRVLPDTADNIAAMLRSNPTMDCFFPRELHVYDGSGRTIDTTKLLPALPNVHYFEQRPMDPECLSDTAFSIGFETPLCTPFTVTITLMQLAAGMGFTEIYLFGCDTSYSLPASVLQEGMTVHSETDSGNGRLLLTSTADDDPNHFCGNYFGRNRQWHHPKPWEMLRHYALAKDVLDDIGVAVFNATVGGKLDVFERVDYRSVLTQ